MARDEYGNEPTLGQPLDEPEPENWRDILFVSLIAGFFWGMVFGSAIWVLMVW